MKPASRTSRLEKCAKKQSRTTVWATDGRSDREAAKGAKRRKVRVGRNGSPTWIRTTKKSRFRMPVSCRFCNREDCSERAIPRPFVHHWYTDNGLRNDRLRYCVDVHRTGRPSCLRCTTTRGVRPSGPKSIVLPGRASEMGRGHLQLDHGEAVKVSVLRKIKTLQPPPVPCA